MGWEEKFWSLNKNSHNNYSTLPNVPTWHNCLNTRLMSCRMRNITQFRQQMAAGLHWVGIMHWVGMTGWPVGEREKWSNST